MGGLGRHTAGFVLAVQRVRLHGLRPHLQGRMLLELVSLATLVAHMRSVPKKYQRVIVGRRGSHSHMQVS